MSTDALRERAASDTVHLTTFAHPDKSTGSYAKDAIKYGLMGALLSGAAGAGVGSLRNKLQGSPSSPIQAAIDSAKGAAMAGGATGALGGLVSRKLKNDEDSEPGKGLDRARKVNLAENTLIGGVAGSTLGSLLHLYLNKGKPMNTSDVLKYVGGGGALGASLGYLTSPHHNVEHDFYRKHVKQAKFYKPENYEVKMEAKKRDYNQWKLYAGGNDWENGNMMFWLVSDADDPNSDSTRHWYQVDYPYGEDDKPGAEEREQEWLAENTRKVMAACNKCKKFDEVKEALDGMDCWRDYGSDTQEWMKKKAQLFTKELLLERKKINQNPSEAQIESGNYAKGHVTFKGLKITLENGKGHTRSGTSSQGTKWSVKLKHDYGYFPGTTGKDGDEVDVFIGGDLDSDNVYVVNQTFGNKFDEHKVMVGFKDMASAKKGYLSNYTRGWKGMGTVVKCHIDDFKEWLKTGNKKKPFKQMEKKAYHPVYGMGSYGQTIGRYAGKGGLTGALLGALYGTATGTARDGIKGTVPGLAGGALAGTIVGGLLGGAGGYMAEKNRRDEEKEVGSGLRSAFTIDRTRKRGRDAIIGALLGVLGGGASSHLLGGKVGTGAILGGLSGAAGGYMLSPKLRDRQQVYEDYGPAMAQTVFELNRHLEDGGDPDEFLSSKNIGF